ncbi:MAG: Long-chain-fatty-acid--CoA ligase [Deltaproteobacteria bacterium]|nr:Long-chain-fatty-acid--CoA ligase [Deltaproteobacteria bacterium]
MAISTVTTTAPLNPAYKQDEFEFYLEDLRAKALVVQAGSTSPVVEAARKLGIIIIELITGTDRAAGDFDLISNSGNRAEHSGPSEADDIALILHTSGTTVRPKIVPLSHKNVTASDDNIAKLLMLTPEDRCLNVMPLFHINGLIDAVLSSLGAGASIHCTPGFNALRFFNWMNEAKPTWYTAVPSKHQAVLSRADKNRDVIDSVPLRFIRSSSSSQPSQVFAEL